jgi:hypothetical protein
MNYYLYFNRRIERKENINGAKRDEFYFYDGDNVVLDAVDPDGFGVSPAPASRYRWGQA